MIRGGVRRGVALFACPYLPALPRYGKKSTSVKKRDTPLRQALNGIMTQSVRFSERDVSMPDDRQSLALPSSSSEP